MAKDYIELRDGAYKVVGTRVSLDSVVYAYLQGESAEGILESYPALTLEQIHGALAYYLANRNEVDAYLREGERQFERLREESRRKDPAFYARLAEARERMRRER